MTLDGQSPPKLSVITIGYESASDCRSVILELLRQTIRSQIELILVTPSRAGISEEDLHGFGAWQHLFLPQIQTTGRALAAAVHVARAPFVTYAEEHAYFSENWAERILDAHAKGYDVVGFPVENANPQSLTSWSSLYDEFGPIVAPIKSGETKLLGAHHASYRKQLLLDYGALLVDVLENEAALLLDLRAKGRRFYMAGDAMTSHVNISMLAAYVYTNYLGMRTFAASRAMLGNWSWWKRLVFIGGAPLIPWVRLRRILADIKRTGRQGALLPRILLPLFPALCAGAFGEMLGYAFGSGNCAQRRAHAELQRERFVLKQERGFKKEHVPQS